MLPGSANKESRKFGLGVWMERVLEQCDRVGKALEPDPVHDLRVALRRCRSMADGLMAMDPNPAWKDMKKASRRLFSRLGDLRDVQVMADWMHRLDTSGDPVTNRVLESLVLRETHLKHEAAQALQEFDRKQWRRWAKSLSRRSARLRPGSLVFKHLALERWMQARELHRRALRNRSQIAFHQLRIGLKRFRYIVENFLPQQHATWSDDLKELQDLLGEVHDLDVLWPMLQHIAVFPDSESRLRWRTRITQERTERIDKYRQRMVGPTALWGVWRSELPQGNQIKSIAEQRVRLWASSLDPDFQHSRHVAQLALQLYDGMENGHSNGTSTVPNPREVLRFAALLHEVGRSKREKGHHKSTYRLLRKFAVPLGIGSPELRLAAAVARYHRGTLPRAGQKTLVGLSAAERKTVVRLAGFLRLANALDADHAGRIQNLEVQQKNGCVVVAAQGYNARDRLAEGIAGARHLLEITSHRPVMIQALRQKLASSTRTPIAATKN